MMCVVLFSAENPKLVSRSLTFYTLSKLWHYWHIDIHCIMFYFNNISTFQQLFLNYDCRCDVDMLLGLRKFTLNPIVKREQKSRNLLLVGYCDIINSFSIFIKLSRRHQFLIGLLNKNLCPEQLLTVKTL